MAARHSGSPSADPARRPGVRRARRRPGRGGRPPGDRLVDRARATPTCWASPTTWSSLPTISRRRVDARGGALRGRALHSRRGRGDARPGHQSRRDRGCGADRGRGRDRWRSRRCRQAPRAGREAGHAAAVRGAHGRDPGRDADGPARDRPLPLSAAEGRPPPSGAGRLQGDVHRRPHSTEPQTQFSAFAVRHPAVHAGLGLPACRRAAAGALVARQLGPHRPVPPWRALRQQAPQRPADRAGRRRRTSAGSASPATSSAASSLARSSSTRSFPRTTERARMGR